jgi:hypothetical protein
MFLLDALKVEDEEEREDVETADEVEEDEGDEVERDGDEEGEEGEEQTSATGDDGPRGEDTGEDSGLIVVSCDSRSHSSRSMRLRAGWSSPRLVPTRDRR